MSAPATVPFESYWSLQHRLLDDYCSRKKARSLHLSIGLVAGFPDPKSTLQSWPFSFEAFRDRELSQIAVLEQLGRCRQF